MISFIVIGRNEEKNIRRCIKSIYKAILFTGISRYEIIYVDSKSTDNTVQIVSWFPQIKIYKVTGKCSCAVARNIGVSEASGNVFFFIDGDMEIYSDFLAKVWSNESEDITEDFISGICLDVSIEGEKRRFTSRSCVGGTFLIKRKLWDLVGGMRTRFQNAEDSDFSIRLMSRGHFFIRKNEFIVKHHTVPYLHESRLWKAMWNKDVFYCRSVLLRHHLFNRYMYRMIWNNDKSFIIFISTILVAISSPGGGLLMFIFYLLAIAIRVAKNTIYVPFASMMRYYFLMDVLNLVYFFTFFPKDVKEEYIGVRA